MTDHPTHRLDQPRNQPPEHPTQHLPGEREPTPRPCLRCGQPLIDAEAGTVNSAQRNTDHCPMTVRRQTPVMGFWGPKTAQAYCRALVCVACGYTELQTIDPQRLLGEEVS